MPAGPWPVMPGIPTGGHVTSGGAWHPGAILHCTRCEPSVIHTPVHRRTTR